MVLQSDEKPLPWKVQFLPARDEAVWKGWLQGAGEHADSQVVVPGDFALSLCSTPDSLCLVLDSSPLSSAGHLSLFRIFWFLMQLTTEKQCDRMRNVAILFILQLPTLSSITSISFPPPAASSSLSYGSSNSIVHCLLRRKMNGEIISCLCLNLAKIKQGTAGLTRCGIHAVSKCTRRRRNPILGNGC